MHRPALLAAWLLLSALAEPAAAKRYLIHTYREELPTATVRSVAQDRDGRIWVATPAGLVAYDGAEWAPYGPEQGLPARDIARLAVDSDGTLWSVASLDPVRISRFDGGLWKALPAAAAPPDAEVLSLLTIPREGTDLVLVGLSSGGIAVRSSEWTAHPVDHPVRAMVSWEGLLWVGTDRGVHAFRMARDGRLQPADDIVPAALRDGNAHALVPDGELLWVCGPGRVGRVEGDRFLEIPGIPEPADDGAVVAAPDGHGGLYFGSPASFFHYRPETGTERLGTASGLASEGSTDLLRDREGNLWIGGVRGLSKLVSQRFAVYDESHGLLTDEVSAILRRRSGEVVLGHPGGLTFLEYRTAEPRVLRTLPFSDRLAYGRAMDLHENDEGTVWVAGNRMGLAEIRKGSITWHDPSGVGAPVSSVVTEPGGRVWCAALSLFVRDESGRPFRQFPLEGQRSSFIRRLHRAGDGSLLVAMSGAGLFRIRGDSVQEPFRAPADGGDDLYTVHETRDGTVWVGTRAGLFRLDGSELQRADLGGHSIRRPVYLLLEDAAANLWIGTNHGVARWDGETIHHFTPRDGLAGLEANRAAGYADSHGHVWIGTERGVSVYHPEFDIAPLHGPTVELLPIDVDGVMVPVADSVALNAGDDTLIFRFRAISFVDERAVQFRIRLEGFDAEWLPFQELPQRSIRYTNLPPGRYRLHVQARDVHGARSPVVTSPAIRVPRPLLDNPWFRAVAGITLLGALGTGAIVLLQRRYANSLEAIVRSRTEALRETERELARAHRMEALGVLAGGIAHDFNNLLQVILGGASVLEVTAKLKERPGAVLAELKGAARRAQVLTDQLLTFSRGGEPVRRATDLTSLVRESATFGLAGAPARALVGIADDLWAVEVDAGQIGRALDNLILNARQATPDGGAVRIRASNVMSAPHPAPRGPHVLLEIEDDGPGIPESVVERIFDPFFSTKPGGTGLGLSVAHSVVERHGGNLSVESRPGHGTIFRMRLPALLAPDGVPRRASQLPVPEASLPEPAGSTGQRILVMEDETAVLRTIEVLLQQLGYEVTSTRDGREAVEAYRRAFLEGDPHDALLLDLRVPSGFGGAEALERIRTFDPDVRAVVITGYSEDPVLARRKEHGFAGSLAKPFTPEELGEVLDSVLQAPRAAGPA